MSNPNEHIDKYTQYRQKYTDNRNKTITSNQNQKQAETVEQLIKRNRKARINVDKEIEDSKSYRSRSPNHSNRLHTEPNVEKKATSEILTFSAEKNKKFENLSKNDVKPKLGNLDSYSHIENNSQNLKSQEHTQKWPSQVLNNKKHHGSEISSDLKKFVKENLNFDSGADSGPMGEDQQPFEIGKNYISAGYGQPRSQNPQSESTSRHIKISECKDPDSFKNARSADLEELHSIRISKADSEIEKGEEDLAFYIRKTKNENFALNERKDLFGAKLADSYTKYDKIMKKEHNKEDANSFQNQNLKNIKIREPYYSNEKKRPTNNSQSQNLKKSLRNVLKAPIGKFYFI